MPDPSHRGCEHDMERKSQNDNIMTATPGATAVGAAGASCGKNRCSGRCRRASQVEERREGRGDSGLPVPPEVMSLVLLCTDGATLSHASYVSKALHALVTVKHWESAARRAVWLQKPTPASASFKSREEATGYWRRWSKLAAGAPGTPSGRLVVVGGNEIPTVEASGKTEAFLDVRYGETLTWKALPSLEVPRSAAGTAVDRFGSLVTLGGWDNEGALNSCECLAHPPAAAAATLRQRQQQQQRRRPLIANACSETVGKNAGSSSPSFGGSSSAAAAVAARVRTSNNGEAASTGASSATGETVVPAAEDWRWKALPPLQRRRCFLGAAFEPRGALLAVGGGTGPYRNDSAFETVEMLLPGAEAWVAGPSMGEARCGLGATALADGKIVAVGGYGGDLVYRNSAEVLDPYAERWTALAPMQRRRTGVAVAVGPGGRLYAVGGSADGSHGLSSVETLDPREGKWGSSPPMIFGRAYCCASFAASGCLYVVGGISAPTGVMRTVEVFDPQSERWRLEERFGAGDGERVVTDACLAFQP